MLGALIPILLSPIFGVQAQQENTAQIPDSLLRVSYQELADIIAPIKRDSLRVSPYVNAFMAKAKKDGDTLTLAEAYRNMVYVSPPEMQFQYADSILWLTKDMVHKRFPDYGYSVKATVLYKKDQYEEALEQLLNAYESALQSGNLRRQHNHQYDMAALRGIVGESDKAIALYKEIYEGFRDTLNPPSFEKTQVLFNLFNNYLRIGVLDSAQYYLNEGLQESLSRNDTIRHAKFWSNQGVLQYYKGAYQKAIPILTETLEKVAVQSSVQNYYYRAKSNLALGNQEAAIPDLKIMDSIVDANGYVIPEMLDVYKLLSEHYENRGDYRAQLDYMDRYVSFDSVLDNRYKYLKANLSSGYDMPELERKKEHALAQLRNRTVTYQRYLYLSTGIATLLLLLAIHYFRKRRLAQKRFQELLARTQRKSASQKSVPTDGIHGIAEAVLLPIREKLLRFENGNGFLSQKISLASLSKKMGTNSNYLSKIINHDKGKNFSNYINDLRIDHVIEALKTDARLRKLTVQALGEEIGFNRSESFSKAFYKKTKMYPSDFIKRLERHRKEILLGK
ncbi:helix-turn-helix domain-containing protein [Maribacter sp. 2-571]|uniref:helix-turn-helix domain-containing protein n=1 Tax=Maribacter sp. 2-571 TaxID=3417569 RepID=UPI003D3537EC